MVRKCLSQILYPRLYRISNQQESSVSKFDEVDWNFDFRRRLGVEDVAEWNELQQSLESVEIQDEDDAVI